MEKKRVFYKAVLRQELSKELAYKHYIENNRKYKFSDIYFYVYEQLLKLSVARLMMLYTKVFNRYFVGY